jgi:CheY-like chemotaxis protein
VSCSAPDEIARTARQHKRVLVITDDPPLRSRTVALFETGGYSVSAGQDSLEVLSLVEQELPHIIVLMTSLPSHLGLEMLTLLRGRVGRALPMILSSADATLILAPDSPHAHPVGDGPIALHELLPYVDRLTLNR